MKMKCQEILHQTTSHSNESIEKLYESKQMLEQMLKDGCGNRETLISVLDDYKLIIEKIKEKLN